MTRRSFCSSGGSTPRSAAAAVAQVVELDLVAADGAPLRTSERRELEEGKERVRLVVAQRSAGRREGPLGTERLCARHEDLSVLAMDAIRG